MQKTRNASIAGSRAAGSVLKNGRLLLVEESASKPGLLTPENFARRVCLGPLQRRFVRELFDGPMSEKKVGAFFSSKECRAQHFSVINKEFVRVYGKPAVLRVDFDGRTRRICLFSFTHLNPKLFFVPPVAIVPGRDFCWRDVFSPCEQRVVAFLLQNSHSAVETVSRELKMDAHDVTNLITLHVNAKMRASGLPEAVFRTKIKPHLYYANPAFACLFGEQVRVARISRDVFTEGELALLQHLAESPDSTLSELQKASRSSDVTLYKRIRRIREVAKTFGFDAIKIHRIGMRKRCRLSQELASALNLETSREKSSKLFSAGQLKILRFIIERPCTDFEPLCRKTKIKRHTLNVMLIKIRRTCRQFGLDGLVCVRKRPSLYYATEAFARQFVEEFGWKFRKVSPADVLTGEIMRPVGEFYLKSPHAAIRDCVIELRAAGVKVTRQQVLTARAQCNRSLKKHGLPCLPSLNAPSHPLNVRPPSLRAQAVAEPVVSESMVAYRLTRGQWPKERRAERRQLLSRLKRDKQVAARVAEHDLKLLRDKVAAGEMDYSKFDGEHLVVARAVRNAVLSGVELASLMQILSESGGNALQALKKINALITGTNVSLLEHDATRANPHVAD